MTARMTPTPQIELLPIDDFARNGAFQLVLDTEGAFAVARWIHTGWYFSSGVPLDFEPTDYHPSQAVIHA